MTRSLFIICCFLIFYGGYSQQTSQVDFKHLKAEIAISPLEEKVQGNLSYTFDVLTETDSMYIDAREMEIEEVKLNGEKAHVHNDGLRLWIISDFRPSSKNIITFRYTATPSQAMYFSNWNTLEEVKQKTSKDIEGQVFTQGQGKYTSHWLPSFDDTNEKLEFDLTINFPTGYDVIANGVLRDSSPVSDSLTQWEYDMTEPMSSYLIAIAAGKYQKQEASAGGVPLLNYYYPEDEEKVGPTYRYTEEIFQFLEKEIGVAYPWQNYKQIPVRNFLYAGMENTGTTIFSDLFLVDSTGFNDRNYVNVNAHELAHQWFGNLVTAGSGEHHWLQEGFATYYALLAEKEIFGDEHFYWKMFESAEQLKELSDEGKGEALINPRASSLTYYQKGAWALHILREQVGKKPFDEAVRNYLDRYKFGNVTTSDFLDEVEKTSGQGLSAFRSLWLEQSAFPATVALNSLQKSQFISDYLQIAALKEVPLQGKKELLDRALDFPVNEYIGREVIYQLAYEDPLKVIDLYEKAFETNNLYVRQAIAASLKQIPQDLKSEYESLLNDDSYLTREMALFNLWLNFPEDRAKCLDRMKGVEGFNDKNIRTLWLALNLATAGYEQSKKTDRYAELSGYTSPYYPYQIRQNAFNYLFQLNSFTDENLKHLIQASRHHVGRFRDSSRRILRELIKSDSYRQRFKNLSQDLDSGEKAFIEHELN